MAYSITVRRTAIVLDHEERPAVEIAVEDGLATVRRIPANGNVRPVAIHDLYRAVEELYGRDGDR